MAENAQTFDIVIPINFRSALTHYQPFVFSAGTTIVAIADALSPQLRPKYIVDIELFK